MNLSGFTAYIKQLWRNDPDQSTPLSAERLLHIEDGIKMNSDGIEQLAAAVVSQIMNDPNKIASMAALFAVNQRVDQVNSDLTVSDITVVPNEIALVSYEVECFKVGEMAFLSGRIRSAAQGGDLILLSVGAVCARTVYAPIVGDVDTVAFAGLDAGGSNVKFYIPKIDKDYRFFIAFPIL